VEFNELMKKRTRASNTDLDAMWSFIEKNKRTWTSEQRDQVSKAMEGANPP
jgi:hypothetical protein